MESVLVVRQIPSASFPGCPYELPCKGCRRLPLKGNRFEVFGDVFLAMCTTLKITRGEDFSGIESLFCIAEPQAAGKNVSAPAAQLMSVEYDTTELAALADEKIRTFQADASREAGILHHLITLPTYHTAALSTNNLAKEYFGDQGMLGYVAGVQRKEIRQGIACVKHQKMSGADIGDDHKEYLSGEAALKAAGKDNTMNKF